MNDTRSRQSPTASSINLRREIVGVDQEMPLLDGRMLPYVNLDNAASTPSFVSVKDKVDEVLNWYASVHRGSGLKSLVSTHLYDRAREVVAGFVNADPQHDCVIFVKNTTEAINKLANRFNFQPDEVVVTTVMEHHSNDLPWRNKAKTVHAEVLPDGSLDVSHVEHLIKQNAGKVRLVAVTGASNVSGYLPPIHDIAEMAHAHAAMIFVDCAQLLPHRQVDMGKPGSARHLDFIAFSGHKVYAPYGGGALIGPKDFFNSSPPDSRGGGTIEVVTLDEVYWAHAPERDEAGSPNVIGAVALATSLQRLTEIGMDALAAHEAELTGYAFRKLANIPGVRVFGSADPARVADRLGVIAFQMDGQPHARLAAILSFEAAIGVRNGCYCAHPYVLRLLGISDQEFITHRERALMHDRSELPGMVRMSFGCYNQRSDIDRLVEMLERIAAGEVIGDYRVEKRSGAYYPAGFDLMALQGVKPPRL